MIKIIDPDKYAECTSCRRTDSNLLRTFKIGLEVRSCYEVTLCTECLSEMLRQEILYQPKGE